MKESIGTIRVRYSCGTNVARFRGKTASATSGALNAADKVAFKVLGDVDYELKPMPNDSFDVVMEAQA